MNHRLGVFLILLCFTPILCVTAEEDHSTELYLIKEIVEISTDWTDIKWDAALSVYTSSYRVLEGDEAILQGMDVNGLDVWVAKGPFDDTRVVVEIEAIIGKPSQLLSLFVEKGDIESTNVTIYSYDETGEYRRVVSQNSSGPGPFNYQLKILDENAYSPGKAITQKTVEELQGHVYAFYYPWYGNLDGPSGSTFHWDYYTVNNIVSSTHYPLLGPYDSYDPDIIRAHISLAKQAGIDGFILSWWGPKTYEDRAVKTILDVAEEMEFKISAYYESVRDIDQKQVTEELEYFFKSYGDHPAFLTESGQPVLFVYVPGYKDRSVDFWLQVRENVEEEYGPVTLIADHSDPDYLPAFEAFHTYIYTGDEPLRVFGEAMERMSTSLSGSPVERISALKNGEDLILYEKPFFVTVNPGFKSYEWSQGDLLAEREDGDRYRRNWETALELNAHTVLITSWNEWHEGTEVEPSREYGFDYLGLTREYIEEYKQVSMVSRESEIDASITGLEETQSNEATIHVTASNGPLVAVNVSLTGDFTVLNLEGDFIPYLKDIIDGCGWIQIPYIGAGETRMIQATSATEGLPSYNLTVKGYDLSGKTHTITLGGNEQVMTNLTCETVTSTIKAWDNIEIIGQITPPIQNAEIHLKIVSPEGEETSHIVHTDGDGKYYMAYRIETIGQWRISVSYNGDSTYFRSNTETIFQVAEQSTLFSTRNYLMILFSVILVLVIITRVRRKQP